MIGLNADARILAEKAQTECQSYRLQYDVPPTVEYISKHIANIQQVCFYIVCNYFLNLFILLFYLFVVYFILFYFITSFFSYQLIHTYDYEINKEIKK